MEDCGKSHARRKALSGENTRPSGLLDLLFRLATEEFGLDDQRHLGQMTLSKDLRGKWAPGKRFLAY